ncbi:MAG: VOC family protein [Opitutae bacterium]|nr:VOC family protein [Opitutae bacterium]
MSPPNHALGGLMQVAITTKNVPALAAYYRDVVGLKHLFDAGPNLSFFDLGGVRLMISVPSSPELDHPASVFYYRVADIEAAHAALKARGAREERPPGLTARMPDHELWTSFFRDPDDNLFALMCEKR